MLLTVLSSNAPGQVSFGVSSSGAERTGASVPEPSRRLGTRCPGSTRMRREAWTRRFGRGPMKGTIRWFRRHQRPTPFGNRERYASCRRSDWYAAIRRDARAGVSNRALQRQHGVGYRTVVAALESAWPKERKPPPKRGSRLDQCRGVIDDWLRADLDAPGVLARHCIHARSRSRASAGTGNRPSPGTPGGSPRAPSAPKS